MRYQVLSILAAASALSGCVTITSTAVPTQIVTSHQARVGTTISFEHIDTLDPSKVQQIALEVPGEIKTQNGVRLYRLVYRSQVRGKAVNASALIAIPESPTAPKGLVIYLKGSDIHRDAAPTTPNAIWTTEAAIYGGNGYVTVLPDYLGFGASPSPQAFLLTAENVADFRAALVASKEAAGMHRSVPLFITGFSQGGQLSAALHRDLEAHPLAGFDLKATVSIAGPHELVQSFAARLEEPLASHPLAMGYVAWVAYSYAWKDDRPLNEIFQPAYADKVAGWFSGTMRAEEIGAQLPRNVSNLLQPAFLNAVRTDETFWFNRRLRDNETFDWAPKKPLKIVLGTADFNVAPSSTRIFYNRAKAKGGTISKVELPGLDHMQTGNAAYATALALFQEKSSDR